jgi:microcystin-dependent protein
MADGVEIEDLSIASSIADSDAFLIQQSGTTRQIDFETMRKDAVDKGIVEKELVNSTQLETAVAAVSDELDAVKAQIPAQASSSNQLADKEFVNSSIATNTSNFCGTFNSVAELEAYSGAKTNNDYAFVVTTDAAGNTKYNRYKYVEDTTPSWVFEYTLNNSSFTAEQWAAIQSGITAELVALVQNLTVQVPVGVPFPYCGDFGTDPTDPAHKYDLVPAGFLACDGQEVSRETYYILFGVIGTKFGAGDGSTTFNLPDFRETVLVGAGESTRADIASHDVYSVGEFKDDQLQGHEHNYQYRQFDNNKVNPSSGTYIARGEITRKTSAIVTDNTNGIPRVGTTTHGKQVGVNYIIKY